MKRLNLKKYKDSSYLWKWIWNIYSDDWAESSREGEINKHSAHSKLQNLFILLRRGLSWLSCLCQKNTLTPQLSSLHRRHSITVKKLWVGLCFQQLWFARLSLSLSLSVALIFHFSCTPPPLLCIILFRVSLHLISNLKWVKRESWSLFYWLILTGFI